jgi:large subunit ribosomal protein L19e
MKLEKKKALAAKTLKVGKDRIIFNKNRLNEIKEAITKQDIRDLAVDGAIFVRDIKGRKAVVRRSNRRRAGSVRKKVKNSKAKYVIITRKLRTYLKSLKNDGKIKHEQYKTTRKQIRASIFRSKSQMKEHLAIK